MNTKFFTPTDTENLKKSLSVGMFVKVNGYGILRISGIYDKLFTGVDNKLKTHSCTYIDALMGKIVKVDWFEPVRKSITYVRPKKQHYYAVVRGRKTGLFKSWDTCKKQVDGYSNPKFKKFGNIDSALGYLNKHGIRVKERK